MLSDREHTQNSVDQAILHHTPGPWRFDRDWNRIPTILGADGSKVACVEKSDFIHGKFPGIGQSVPKPEREANACLIEAAPALLAAADAARQAIQYSIDMGGTDPAGVLLQALNKCDSAIAALLPRSRVPG